MRPSFSLISVVLIFPALFAQNVAPNASSTQQIVHTIESQSEPTNFANIRYVTPSWNWSQAPATPSTLTAGSNIVTLVPCPLGVDTSANAHYLYKVHIAGTGTSEDALVTGGSCTPGAARGTIVFTAGVAHPPGYTVSSSSTGIQEAINDAWINDLGTAPGALAAPYVKLESNTLYTVTSSIYLRGRGSVLDGGGALLQCRTRDRCIYVGVTGAFPYANHHKLYNISMGTTVLIDGANVTSVCAGLSCSSPQTAGTYIVRTTAGHPFVSGDTVDCEYYSNGGSQHWMASVIQSNLTSNTFSVRFQRGNFPTSVGTFGWCNLENAAIEVNSDHAEIEDLNIFSSGTTGNGAFSYGVINDNDQQLIIERATNRSTPGINPGGNHSTSTWPIGAYLYQRNDQGMNGITYMHDSEFTNVNCVSGGGNGMVFTDSVCQGFPTFGLRYFGALQPLTFSNVYEESTGGSPNGLYSGGPTAQMGLLTQGGAGTRVVGTFPISGITPSFATGGGQAVQRNYFVVPRSNGTFYGPVLFVGNAQPRNSDVTVNVQWPSVSTVSTANLTWDILVTIGSTAKTLPPFGTGTYSLATGISGSCTTTGMCSFSDTQGTISRYTVQVQTFNPTFWFWPANIAINGSAPLFIDSVSDSPSYVASVGIKQVSVVADQCTSNGVAAQRSPIWIYCVGIPGAEATVLQQVDDGNNGPPSGSKGKLIFGGNTIHLFPNDIITLQDSNRFKTLSYSGQRPLADAGDMALGLDQADGLSLRAKTSISQYLNTIPDNSSFLTRLSTSGFAVNANFNAYRNPVMKTANFTVLASQSGGFLDNTGAPGEVAFTLPTCSSIGLTYTFYIDNPKMLKVVASGGAKIRNSSSLGAANGNIAATTTGNSVTLQCIGTSGADSVAEWIVTAIIGEWTVQ